MTAPSFQLLPYRAYRGPVQGPSRAVWALARTGLSLLLRRKLFWAFYALALMIFFFFFYGQYLIVWIQQQTAQQTVPLLGVRIRIGDLMKQLEAFNLNGSANTYGNLIWFEGYIAMIILALAGAILVGNDFHFRSLPYYLSKPITRVHYILGKSLAIALLIALMTTVPALTLYIQAMLLYEWRSYVSSHGQELLGILAYGLVITVTLSTLLLATAVWVRRTVPLVMIWATLFVLSRILSRFLVDGQNLHESWRLIDLWNNMYIVGIEALGGEYNEARYGAQPPAWQALLVCLFVIVISFTYLKRRIAAVEVVS